MVHFKNLTVPINYFLINKKNDTLDSEIKCKKLILGRPNSNYLMII